MADVVNLRRARKTRDRRAEQAVAAGNRFRYGRSAGEKARDRLEAARLKDAINGARREPE